VDQSGTIKERRSGVPVAIGETRDIATTQARFKILQEVLQFSEPFAVPWLRAVSIAPMALGAVLLGGEVGTKNPFFAIAFSCNKKTCQGNCEF
jgi:hypothetical protein